MREIGAVQLDLSYLCHAFIKTVVTVCSLLLAWDQSSYSSEICGFPSSPIEATHITRLAPASLNFIVSLKRNVPSASFSVSNGKSDLRSGHSDSRSKMKLTSTFERTAASVMSFQLL